jgi:cystathionine gamma-synthase
MYWALRNWLMTDAVAWGLDVSFVDMANIDALRGALKPGKTKLVWVETPSNPLWSLTDLEAAADWTHAVGAKIAVDSTVATPVFTRPLSLGVDIVMHAATKSLNGHSDVIAGALATKDQNAFWQRIVSNRKNFGAVLGPFEAFLLMRGMRTLDLRVHAAAKTALD